MPTLYLIDGHAQFFRAYYAIRSGMTSPVTHEPTNLTFSFTGMLLKLLRDQAPDYLAVVIDAAGDRETFRSELYPEYKANREEAPDDFGPQVERCIEILGTMGVPVIGIEGVEADDTIATLVKRLRAEHDELDIRIVSRDKDLTQLVGDHVELFDAHKDAVVTPSDIFKTDDVRPDQVVDILALMGDNVDNVPGVPGIGPKTAAKLILDYGSIDGVYEHIDEIKGKRRENLEAHRDTVALARRLVALDTDVDVDFDLESARWDAGDLPVAALVEMFRQLGFNSHQEQARALASTGSPSSSSSSPSSTTVADPSFEGGLFATVDESAPTIAERAYEEGRYALVTDAAALAGLVDRIRVAGRCAVDTETDSLAPMAARLCGVSIAIDAGQAYYIPTRSPEPDRHLDTSAVLDALSPVLEDPAIVLIGHNIKYDLVVLRHHGVRLRGPMFDTMVASYVLDATRSSHGMDVLALALLDHRALPIKELIGSGRKQKTFDQVPLDRAAAYAAEDADVTLKLHDVMAPQLDATGLRKLFDEIEMPLVDVLAELEYNGIVVDPAELGRQRERLAERIEKLRSDIDGAAPHPFNPDSPKQLATALFNAPGDEPPGLGLKVVKRGKTGPSTDQEVLEKLAQDPDVTSPVPRLILEYRQLTKLVNTYLVALVECIHPDTGRVHASFNQTVAATGRLSSSDPNLQNIPIRTEVGREIRRAFVAAPGHQLLSADYSQIELRLLAHLAQDPALVEAFHAGADIHRAVAAEVFGVAPDDVTGEQRTTAKMINFGIVYGITPYGLSRRLGDVSVPDAARIIDDYKAKFAGIDAFLAACVQQAEQQGFVETILGRRRAIPQIHARHPQQRALGERMAINTIVQGSAADLIKLAMLDLHAALPGRCPGTRMLLQIHDELVFEAPDDELAEAEPFVVERMEGAMELSVPLVVDSAHAPSWAGAK